MVRVGAKRVGPPGWAGFCLGICLLSGAVPGAGAAELSPRQQRVYQDICATCHAGPGSGAPLTGDARAWEGPNAQGFAALLAHTVDGLGSMPPLGTCGSCSEADLRALITFLSGLPDPGP